MREQKAWSDGAYAGFWQRVAGSVLDSLLFVAVTMVLMFVVVGVVGGVAAGDQAEAEALMDSVMGLVFLAALVAYFLYDTLMTSRTGATLGKRAAGVEMRTTSGELPSFARCTGRFFARYLSGIPLSLGYLWAVWDPQNQTWHDKLCDTVVLKREALVPVGSWSYQPIGGWGAPPAAAASWSSPAGPSAGPAPHWPAAGSSPAGPSAGPAPAANAATDAVGQNRPDHARREGQGTGGAAWGGVQGETMETATWGRPMPATRDDVPAREGGGQGHGSPPPGAGPNDTGHWGTPGRAPAPGGSVSERSEGRYEAPSPGAFAPMGERPDPNAIAIQRAGLAPDAAVWLRQVAEQVDARLDRVSETWRTSAQADAARACAFGILLGHLARVHPHMAADLGKVAEAHPSFSTLLEGSRLATLVEIAAEPGRATAWLGPLIDVTDPERIGRLLS